MSLKKILIIGSIAVFSLALVFNVFGKDSSGSVKSTSENSSNTEIVFFWLPTGVPCQQQDKTLQAMEKDNPNLKVTRVDVSDQTSSSLANKYGIRSVPSIVVLGEEGKTVKQFAPGIQTEATLKKYLN